MADVFVSYARSTAKQAQAAAAALRVMGYSVWLDEDLPTHRAYADVIEEQILAAKAVVVIWSADAARSQWVRSEAEHARTERKLVQFAIENVRLPMPFDQIQCANLAGWSGDGAHPGWSKVVASVDALARGADAAQASPAADAAANATVKAAAEPLLAVLAFDNLAGDEEMAFFCDGVSEEIQRTVARGAALKVIGRASSFQFRGADKAAANVAAHLSATHVLDGSVRRSGERVRISAQLIEARSEVTLWSNRFDRNLTDIFALQDEIATAVAAALKVAFAPAPALGPIAPEVFDLYLRARDAGITIEAGERLTRLRQVTAEAPRFAPGWAWLAWWQAWYRLGADLRQGLAQSAGLVERADAQRSAEMALSLDGRSTVAFAALANLEPINHYAARELHLEQALSAAAPDRFTLHMMAMFLDELGRTRDALAYAKQAYELDALYPPAAATVAALELRLGRYEQGQRQFEAFQRRWPDDPSFVFPALGWAIHARDWSRVDVIIRRAQETGHAALPVARGLFGLGKAVRGVDPDFTVRQLDRIEKGLEANGAPRLDLLIGAMALGLTDEVFSAIDRADYARLLNGMAGNTGGHFTPAVIFDAVLNAPMMADPRFVRLCAKLGLCDYWVKTDRWPDCADTAKYDFRAEARRLAGA